MKVLVAVLLLLFIRMCPAKILVSTTNITGDITVPTVWIRANSPYLIVGTATLAQDVSLAIMPGVEIYFLQDAALDLSVGSLVAPGSDKDEIIFSSIDYDNGGDPTGELRLGTSSITEAVISGLKAIDGHASDGASFDRVVFQGNGVALDHFNNLIITACEFNDNYYAITNVNGCDVTNSKFAGNNEGTIQGSGITIAQSSLSGSKLCVDSASTSDAVPLSVMNSSITGCTIAFSVSEGPLAQISFNNLLNNDLNVQGHFEGTLASNWWGTTDINKVARTVQLDVKSPPAIKLVSPVSPRPFALQK
jgi:hypothetical protein